jgi:predicted DNA binding protein
MRLAVVGRGEDLRELVEGIPDRSDTEIDRVGEFARRHDIRASGLTERQRDAVAAAVDLRYYGAPRDASLDDVADELDCAPSTASVHLRKAEQTVMEQDAGRTSL